MKKKTRVLILIALYAIFVNSYIVLFLFKVVNTPFFLFLTIGSVAVLSSSTIYTVIQSKDSQEGFIKSKKIYPKSKSFMRKDFDLYEDYIDAMPLIKNYIESNESYEDNPTINKFIFSIFSQEELDKIKLLRLSKMDKILFIREMLYFNTSERKILIENMLKSETKDMEIINYTPPSNIIKMDEQIRVYVRSLVEPGEKTKIIIINMDDIIKVVKERIALLFDYELDVFFLSSGGILLQENSQIRDYDIDDDDEIALIPSRKEKH